MRTPCFFLGNPGASRSSEADVPAEMPKEPTGRGYETLTVCQAPQGALSYMLWHYTFIRPAEEGRIFSRYQEGARVTASTTGPGRPRPVLCVISEWGALPSLSILGLHRLSGRGVSKS